jgi:hypothetical protein
VDFSQKQELAGSKEFLQELSLQEICGVSQVFLQGFYRVGQDVLQHVGQDRPFDKADFFFGKRLLFLSGTDFVRSLLLEKTDFSQKPQTGGEDRLVARTSSVWQ